MTTRENEKKSSEKVNTKKIEKEGTKNCTRREENNVRDQIVESGENDFAGVDFSSEKLGNEQVGQFGTDGRLRNIAKH